MRLTSCYFSMRRSTKIVTKETVTPTWCARGSAVRASKRGRWAAILHIALER